MGTISSDTLAFQSVTFARYGVGIGLEIEGAVSQSSAEGGMG